jgi:di/tricarboxylate transporter
MKRLSDSISDEGSSFIRLSDPATPRGRSGSSSYLLMVGAFLFAGISVSPLFSDFPSSRACLALVCLSLFLWTTDALPPFATAYLVPIVAVWLRVSRSRAAASDLAQELAGSFMDPTVFSLLASFCLTSALTKLNLAARAMRVIFGLFPPRPSHILFALMFANLVGSAVLSPLAATTIVLSFSVPILRLLNPRDPLVKAILFGIALSGNCGGMVNVAGCSQNEIALHVLRDVGVSVSFVEWMLVSVPLCVVLCLIEFFYLKARFRVVSSERIIFLPNHNGGQ